MSTETIAVEITADAELAAAQINQVAVAMRRFSRVWADVFPALTHVAAVIRHSQERAEADAEYRVARAMRRHDPNLDVQLVTTNEGRCRVVVRRLGGWS